MKNCIKCGASLSKGFEFCPGCGTRIIWSAEQERKMAAESASHSKPELSNWRTLVLVLIIFLLVYAIISPIFPWRREGSRAEATEENSTTASILPGTCDKWDIAQDVAIVNATFNSNTNKIMINIQNQRTTVLDIVRIAITYEFKPDHSGDTDLIPVSFTLAPGETIGFIVPLKREPYLLGIEFQDCQKLKISDWNTV